MKSRQEFIAWAEKHPQLAPILAEAKKIEGEDAAHDFSHLVRVALWTIRLAPAENPAEAAAAALLHDLVNIPKNHPDRAKASEFSAREALPLLRRAGFDDDACTRITEAIRDHSFSRGAVPTSCLGKALQDADRLEALGAIGLMRLFSTGARMNAFYFESEDPWAQNRPLEDKKFSFDHFFTKLLKLPDTFQTSIGREEAVRRAKVLESFLDQAADEIGVPRP